MGDYDQRFYDQGFYLSPDQQDLLLAALSSNIPANKQSSRTPQIKTDHSPDGIDSNDLSAPSSAGYERSQAHLNAFGGFGEDQSPFLDFDSNVDFGFHGSGNLIGDLPGTIPGQDYDIGEKRKSMDGKAEAEGEEIGKKRRESESKKPGRKPLTSEPTTVCALFHFSTDELGRVWGLTHATEAQGSKPCCSTGVQRA